MIVRKTAEAQAATPEFSSAQALHLAGHVHALRRRYRKRLADCRKSSSTAAVHALRVETRRLLALLHLLKTLNLKGPLNKLRRTLKKRLDAFDELRDTQVQLRLLKPEIRDFPEAGRLLKMLRRDEARLASQFGRYIRAVKGGCLNRRLKKLERALDADAEVRRKPAGARGDLPALRMAFDRVILLCERVRANNAASIHRMRVAFKQFRYLSELLEPFLPWLTDERRQRMKEYQAAAGKIQDMAVLLGKLDGVVKDGRMTKTAVANLRRELCRRLRQETVSFLARLDEVNEFRPRPGRPVAGRIRTV